MVQLAVNDVFKLEHHIILDENQFPNVFVTLPASKDMGLLGTASDPCFIFLACLAAISIICKPELKLHETFRGRLINLFHRLY